MFLVVYVKSAGALAKSSTYLFVPEPRLMEFGRSSFLSFLCSALKGFCTGTRYDWGILTEFELSLIVRKLLLSGWILNYGRLHRKSLRFPPSSFGSLTATIGEIGVGGRCLRKSQIQIEPAAITSRFSNLHLSLPP